MRINVIDIETMYENNKFSAYCICMILGEKKIKIYGEDVVEKMIKFLEDNKVKTKILYEGLRNNKKNDRRNKKRNRWGSVKKM